MRIKNHIAERIDIDHVVDIAAEVFASHGFSGVGMRELSRRCEVSPPTLYYYFGSKEALFEQACRSKYQKAIDQTTRAVAPEPSAEGTALERLCGSLFDLLTEDSTLFLLLRRDLVQSSASGSSSRARPQYQALIALIARMLPASVNTAAPQRLAFAIAALVFGYCELVHVAGGDAGKRFNQTRRQDLVLATRALLRGSG